MRILAKPQTHGDHVTVRLFFNGAGVGSLTMRSTEWRDFATLLALGAASAGVDDVIVEIVWETQ